MTFDADIPTATGVSESTRIRRCASGLCHDRADVTSVTGTPQFVQQFLQQFDQARAMMKQMASMSIWQRLKMVNSLGKAGAFVPGAQIKTKGDTGKRMSAKERAEARKKKKKR